MTASTDLQLPPITCPSSLIASCPPLLGFHPEQSLICLVHTPGLGRPVVARVDIVGDSRASTCASDLAERLVRTGGTHVALVLWIDAADDAVRNELPSLVLVHQLERALGRHNLAVDLAVATNGRVWWPLLCPDPSCCSGLARPVDGEVAGRVRVQYAVAGFAPLASRSAIAERLAPDPQLVASTQRHLEDAGSAPTGLSQRRRVVDQVWRVLRPHQAGDTEGASSPARHVHPEQRGQFRWLGERSGARGGIVATREAAVRALGDVGVRDALLVRLANDKTGCRGCWQHSIAVLVDVVRAAPPGHVAAPASLLGLVAWLSGDGALGTVAAERALDDDPSYRLALLALQVFGSGIDPRQWRGTMTGLTEEDCLRTTQRRIRQSQAMSPPAQPPGSF